MDLLTISILFFTVVLTTSGGYLIIQWLWPQYNVQIEIIKAYKIENYDRVILLTKDHMNNCNSIDTFVFAARSRIHKKLYNDALSWYEMALQRLELSDHDKTLIEIEIADAYLQIGQKDKAELHYRTALAIDLENEIATYKLALLCYSNKKFELCRKLIRPVLKKNPNLIDMRRLYAECLTQLHIFTKSIRHFGVLERIGENVTSYYYALTLKMLKMYDKAYKVYSDLLIIDTIYSEKIIRDLVEVCIFLKRYHEGLGLIEQFLSRITSNDLYLELRYLRANLFYHRGDQILALQEYQNLYNEKPSYKDLTSIIDKSGIWLSYPFLYNYFTSNESIFEQVITRLVPLGITIFRRTPEYYLALRENTAYVFYRYMHSINTRVSNDIAIIVDQNCPHITFLETWSLQGIATRYTMTGAEYRFVLRSLEDFLMSVKEAVESIASIETYTPLGFVKGFKDAIEIIPISEDIQEILDSKNIAPILNDELLNKALQK